MWGGCLGADRWGHGRECAWRKCSHTELGGSKCLLPASSFWGGVAVFHPTSARVTFPGESGVATGGTADTSAVTHFTGHLPGYLVPPLTGHQGPLPLTPSIWGPGQQERGSFYPSGASERGQCLPDNDKQGAEL